MTIDRMQTVCAWLSFVAIVLGTLASNSFAFKSYDIPGDLTSPVLAIELMRCPDSIVGIVGPEGDPRRAAINRLTEIDLLFIPAYAILFLFVGLILTRRGRRWTGIFVGALGTIGAALDVLEDIGIFRAIRGAGVSPRHWSVPKWAVLFAVIGLVSFVYRTFGEPPLRRVIGFVAVILSLITSVLGLWGVASGNDALIESAGRFMGLSLVAGFLFFATHNVLKAGLCAALDRMTTFKPFARLAGWPSDEVGDEPACVRLFQYDSNMDPTYINSDGRLSDHARLLGVARMNGWDVRFDLFSPQNNCVVADIIQDEREYVLGALYEVPIELVFAGNRQRSIMDEIEESQSDGNGTYQLIHVTAEKGGLEIDAVTYVGTDTAKQQFESMPELDRQVGADYFAHVERGATTLDLPKKYKASLAAKAASSAGERRESI